MLAQSIYGDVHIVLCSIFSSLSPVPGTPNFTGPVKRARPDSVLVLIAVWGYFRQKNCLRVIYTSILGKRPGQKVYRLPRNTLLAR